MEFFYKNIRAYFKDAVYAASDGVIAIFALVAGVAGAALHPLVILILGFASVFSEAFSMGTGNYLGSRSEQALYKNERRSQERSLDANAETPKAAIEEMLKRKEYEGQEREDVLKLIMSKKEFAVDLIMHEELGMSQPIKGSAMRGAIITFLAYAIAGTIPLLPYTFYAYGGAHQLFLWSFVLTGIELFALGAFRTSLTGRHWAASGFEMLAFGGVAALIAFGIGALLRNAVASTSIAF